MTTTYYKIGFHTGPGGNRNGIGDYFRDLDDAGIPAIIKSSDDFGPCYELQEMAKQSGVSHIVVFRLSTAGQNDGFNYDVPDYGLSPQVAAQNHWNHTKAKLPQELDKSITWIEPINEVDKNRADWLGAFALAIAQIANADGYKVTLFGWSSGEPELTGWEMPNMLNYLRYCANNPDKAAVSLHEYSYTINNIKDGFPYKVGRFQMLHDVCDANGIGRPTIHITEFGWEYANVPGVNDGMNQLIDINILYSQFHNVKGAALWYLGGGFGGVANKAQPYIVPITGNALAQGPGDPEPDPDPPTNPNGYWEPVITEYFLGQNEDGDDWYDDGNRQIRTGWLLDMAQGENPLGNSDGLGHDWQPFEARFLWGAWLPPHEWDKFLNQYGQCYSPFADKRPWGGRWKSPNTIQPGKYKVELSYFDDCYDGPNPPPKVPPTDPKSFEIAVGIGSDTFSGFNNPDGWIMSDFQKLNIITMEFENAKENTRAWWAMRARWGIKNPRAFIHSFIVSKWVEGDDGGGGNPPDPDPDPEPDCPGTPRVQYDRVYLLIPPGYGKEWPLAATEATWDDHRYTVGGSADDAGIGALENRKVIAVNPHEWSGDLQAWMETYYPGAVVEVINADTPEELKQKLSGDGPEPPPDPPSTGSARLGLHGTADPGAYPDGEAELFTTAKVEAIKVLSSANPDLVRLMSVDNPDALWIVRAFLKFGGRNISPNQFFDDTINDVKRTLTKIRDGWAYTGANGSDIWLELHNEPNLIEEGLSTSWGSGTYFNEWLRSVVLLYRSALPEIKLMYPGLSPGPAIPNYRQEAFEFLSQSMESASMCDGIGAHIYWNTLPATPYTMEAGLGVLDHYLSMIPSKPWFVTEASNNKQGNPAEKGQEYIKFHSHLMQRPLVKAVTYYISSASVGYEDEVWLGTDIAQIVGQRSN